MRIPLTKYGLPQVALYPAITSVLIAACCGAAIYFPVFWLAAAILTIILVWILSFFRDPKRTVPQNVNLLVSPADGTVSDIEEVDEPTFIGGKAVRLGIFLSVFNVHINRSPCKAKIEKITYRKGKFINALNPDCGKVNESNALAISRLDAPQEKILVRQISGAIARRIVCAAKEGQTFAAGEQFGMIKFGSRTEVYLPANTKAKFAVKIGDKVKAGETIIARYE